MHVKAIRRSRSLAALSAVFLLCLVSPPSALAWSWPADGPVLRPFSVGPDPYAGGQHRGVDIGAEVGGIVVAPVAGSVTFVGFVPGGGRAVTIATDDGYAVTLLQLGATSVAQGGTVAEGAEVGVVGASSDDVTLQPHVHLGVRTAADPNGYVDPLGLLPARAPAPVSPAPAPEPPVAAPTPPATGETPSPQPTLAEAPIVEPGDETAPLTAATPVPRRKRP